MMDQQIQMCDVEIGPQTMGGIGAATLSPERKRVLSRDYPDQDIFQEAATAISALDLVVPTEQVRVTVQDGWLTLAGEVDWRHQREAAEAAVRSLKGVKGIYNRMTVKPRPSAAVVKHQIAEQLWRNAVRTVCQINVEIDESTVVLSGSVPTVTEREEAARAAWRVPGVTRVENHLAVEG